MGWPTVAAEDPASLWGCVSNSHSLLISKALVFQSLLLPGERKKKTEKSHSWPGKKSVWWNNLDSLLVTNHFEAVWPGFNVLSFKCRALEQILPKAYWCNSEFGQLLFSFLNTALQLINLQGENQLCQYSQSEKKNEWRGWMTLNKLMER